MAQRAAHLVDRVFPPVPVRQWVLSLPHRLRYRLAWDHDLCRAVVRAFMRAVLGFLRRQARVAGIVDGRSGAVAIVQRFGGALNLNIHFHALVIDGVFAMDPTGLRFHPHPELDAADVDEVLATVTAHVSRLLARRGLDDVDDGNNTLDEWSDEAPVLAGFTAAAVQGRVALGPRAGAQVRRRGLRPAEVVMSGLGSCHARYQGFDLHAGVRVPAGRRERLERIFRYALRPPIAQERLSLTPEGQVRLELRRQWSDGTTSLVFDPIELLERLAVLTPRPRINLLLYHGVLAPRAAWRSFVVGFRAPVSPGEAAVAAGSSDQSVSDGAGAPRRRVGGRLWADLMARTFGFDVLACPRCGGRLRLIALIEDPSVVLRLLQHLGLPTEIPEPYPPRAPPLLVNGLAAHEAHDDIVFGSRS